VTGRNRQRLSLLVSLLLLVAFGATSGLGIFWVARQELPVFDWHYLFGYVALALAALHVALHWRSLLRLFRRRGRGTGDRPEGASSSWVPWLVPLALVGAGGYWLGMQAGSTEVKVSVARSGASPDAAGAAGRRVMVRDEQGKQQPLARFYHQQTRYFRGKIHGAQPVTWSARPALYRAEAGDKYEPLDDVMPEASMPTGEAIEARRVAPRAIHSGAVTLRQLSTVLHLTNGLTRRGPSVDLRAAPSAGALYPTETYVLVQNVEGLEPGIWHYSMLDHVLRRIKRGKDLATDLARLSARPTLVQRAPVTLIFSSVFRRTSFKYRARSYRYTLLDAGHLLVQAALSAAALGLTSQALAAFDDRQVNALLGLHETREGVVALLPLGLPLPEGGPAPRDLQRFASAPRKLTLDRVPGLIALAHGMTGLRVLGQGAPPPPPPPADPAIRTGQTFELPPASHAGAALGQTIRRRRSVRRFSDAPLSLARLGSLAFHVFGRSGTPPLPDPGVRAGRRLRLYIAAHGVQGLSPGVFAYDPAKHQLVLVARPADQRARFAAAALQQGFVGDAAVVFIFTADVSRLGAPDGDRGYRYANLEAGMLGGQVYLHATAMGLGCTGVGAYYDEDVEALINVKPANEQVLYMLAVGNPAASAR